MDDIICLRLRRGFEIEVKMEEQAEDLLSIGEFKAVFEKNNEKEKIIRVNITSEKDSSKWLEEYKTSTNTGLIVKDPMSSEPKR